MEILNTTLSFLSFLFTAFAGFCFGYWLYDITK